MGRNSTGAYTVKDCLQLRIGSFAELVKQGMNNFKGNITWTGGESVSFRFNQNYELHVLELKYVRTEQGKKMPVKYQIEVVSRPSNLGNGKIYYFVCPFRGQLCRTLYMGYGSGHFKSKEAYKYRIYYASQLSSRMNQYNERYWSIEQKIKELNKKHPKTHYRGEQTKPQKRMKFLEHKNEYNDEKRWEMLCARVMPNFRSFKH